MITPKKMICSSKMLKVNSISFWLRCVINLFKVETGSFFGVSWNKFKEVNLKQMYRHELKHFTLSILK